MPFTGSRRLVGLGFGAIQAGLFVYEAHRTGAYAPLLVVDVRAELVAVLRSAGGTFRVNIAHADRIETVDVGPVEAADPTIATDRASIVAAIADADELTSALPSVNAYRSEDVASPHRLIAEALSRRTRRDPLLVICAENHRRAAALLEEAVLAAVPAGEQEAICGRARWIDSVIGKMSGLIDDPGVVDELGLATITPSTDAAFLVEAFDRILISRAAPRDGPEALRPAMPVLREVDELAPFEDAKLLGHNAIHALAGFLGTLLGLRRVAEVADVPGFMAFLRAAFLEESGRALIARHAGTDPLFTPQGYTAFADDLLARMVNPWLADTIERAARDPRRKLAWDDRLIGLVRLGLAEGVPTPRIAMGAAAGLGIVAPGAPPDAQLLELRALWPTDIDADEAQAVLSIVSAGVDRLRTWRRAGFVGLAI